MAKLKNIVHSQDACTMVFEGNPANPEPTLGAIKFPGGYIEVSRCSDGSYYAHLSRDEEDTRIIASRIDYTFDAAGRNGILDVPDAADIRHIAIRIGRK
jgi:hypothetical protein